MKLNLKGSGRQGKERIEETNYWEQKIKPSQYISNLSSLSKSHPLSIDQFETLSLLSKDKDSCEILKVQHTKTGHIYALKKM
jgi:hypothetical protein